MKPIPLIFCIIALLCAVFGIAMSLVQTNGLRAQEFALTNAASRVRPAPPAATAPPAPRSSPAIVNWMHLSKHDMKLTGWYRYGAGPDGTVNWWYEPGGPFVATNPAPPAFQPAFMRPLKAAGRLSTTNSH